MDKVKYHLEITFMNPKKPPVEFQSSGYAVDEKGLEVRHLEDQSLVVFRAAPDAWASIEILNADEVAGKV
jgi:hypothetical protein